MTHETDRELLELAAKAAGIELGGWSEYKSAFWLGGSVINQLMPWNPLTDDGDALRLAVKLRMSATVFEDAVGIGIKGSFGYREYEITPDPYAATRRAIVRAAAEIGRAMR